MFAFLVSQRTAKTESVQRAHHTARGQTEHAACRTSDVVGTKLLLFAGLSCNSILIFIVAEPPVRRRRLDDRRYLEDPSPADQARDVDPSYLGSSVRRSCIGCVLFLFPRRATKAVPMKCQRGSRFVMACCSVRVVQSTENDVCVLILLYLEIYSMHVHRTTSCKSCGRLRTSVLYLYWQTNPGVDLRFG